MNTSPDRKYYRQNRFSDSQNLDHFLVTGADFDNALCVLLSRSFQWL